MSQVVGMPGSGCALGRPSPASDIHPA
jgi:hypothetical protein